MNTGSESTLSSAKTEIHPGTTDPLTETEAVAFTLVGLQDILSTPDQSGTPRGLSAGCPEEFIVLDD